MKRQHKKAFSLLNSLPAIAVTFGVAIITLSIVATIVNDVQDTQTTNDSDWNVSQKGLYGIEKIANWLPTIGLVLGAVIVIGALGMLFMGRR